MTTWIDVEEIKPQGYVLTYSFFGAFVGASYDLDDDEWYDNDGEIVGGVTYWSDLPEVPQ